MQGVFYALYGWNKYFPLCAALWLVLLCWRRTRYLRAVQAMGAVVLLTLVWVVLFVIGTRWFLHHPWRVAALPVVMVLVWVGTVSAGAAFLDWTA